MGPMKYRLAIFDFDGTLADSFPFFNSVFNQIAEQHGFRKIQPEEVPALRHYNARQMMAHVGVPAWKLPVVASSFIRLMKANADRIAPFDGVDAMLKNLADAGVTLAVVSSNAYDNIERILGLHNVGLISQFECGMSIFGKAERLRKVVGRSGIPADAAIYIGDQVTDLEAARKEKLAFGAVSWGYGAIESLRLHQPDEVFDALADIGRIG